MSYWSPFRPIHEALVKSRVFGLDLLRTIAIVQVLYGHCVLLFGQEGRAILFRFMLIDPVTLFFVLSGFLIGRILLNTFEFEKLSFNTLFTFWLRRWMRTVPAYLATLVLLIFIYRQFDIKLVLRYVFFIQNFNWPHPLWFPEAWSLSIEEWFYFLIPLLLSAVFISQKGHTRKTFLITSFAVILLVPAYRWFRYESITVSTRSEWDHLFRMQVLTRLDSIMYGVLGAYIFRYKLSLWNYNKKMYLIIGLCLLALAWKLNIMYIEREGFYSSVFSFSLDSVASLFILPFFADIKAVKGKVATAVTTVSIISYALYLLNMSFVSLYVCHAIPHFGLTGNRLLAYQVVVYWIVTTVSAVILHLAVEHPFMQLRDRITRKNMRKGEF